MVRCCVCVSGYSFSQALCVCLAIGPARQGVVVLSPTTYMSTVSAASGPLGMAVNVQSEGMASNSQTGSSGQEDASSPSPPSSIDELRTILRQQLEYYFSKDNLATDKYLCEFV